MTNAAKKVCCKIFTDYQEKQKCLDVSDHTGHVITGTQDLFCLKVKP